jgi:hypothetical protein
MGREEKVSFENRLPDSGRSSQAVMGYLPHATVRLQAIQILITLW